MTEEKIKKVEAREYVEEMFKAMPVEQLIKVFNEYVTDTRAFRFPCIYEMDDEEKWEKMYQFYDVFDVVLFTAISSESGQFDVHKKYWLFEEDGQKLHSFNTTEELLKIIGTDAFVDTFYNMEYEYRNVRKGENEYVWWADIYKCDILVATACVVLPIAVSTTMVFYKDGKPDKEFSIYQGSRPTGWVQDDFFKDAVSILNESYPFIPWMPNKAGMFHTK